MKVTQLTLFDDEVLSPTVRTTGKCSSNIIFHDYESYVSKFKDGPKTTDDTYTPRDVYEAVVDYVKTIYPLDGKCILRPFYPGGDYEHAEYPENGVVIDNPPFSIFTKICKFYAMRRIPFFLFGPGLTILSCAKYCTAVFINKAITFENGACVKCNFSTNLLGDTVATTAVKLDKAIAACASQNTKRRLPKYKYPQEVLSASDFQIMSKGDEDFRVSRKECEIIQNLDFHKNGLFADHLLVSKSAAARAAVARAAVAKLKIVKLSEREKKIVDTLRYQQESTDANVCTTITATGHGIEPVNLRIDSKQNEDMNV